ncbi:MAG: chemotaxis protein CheW [Desulfohalobiaceae bacterium]
MKSPEEYLQDQVLLPEQPDANPEVSSLEQEFIRGFLLPEGKELAEQDPQSVQEFSEPLAAKPESSASSPAEPAQVQSSTCLQELQEAEKVEFVGFSLLGQEFALPVLQVREVIRSVSSTKLPTGPDCLEGVLNLRGKVTPLLHLAPLVGVDGLDPQSCSFIIICKEQDLQFGLLVQRITTMHKISQEYIEWDVQSHLVGGSNLISGLIKLDGALLGIVSLQELVQTTLSRSC